MLTGDADHVKKVAGDTILSGSSIIVGEAKCRATEVGDETYAAKLTKKVKGEGRHKSELMSSIIKILKILTVGLALVVCTVVITLVVKISNTGNDPSIWNGLTLSVNDPVTWGLIAVIGGSFGIGMIPSGLVLTTSVALMVSIAQLTKKQTLIQELYSLENLSRIDVICLDKTGTLTDGTMNVVDVKAFAPMDEVTRHVRNIVYAAGERNSTMEAVFKRFGVAEKEEYVENIPFSSATKYSGVGYADGKKVLMGAPEYLLDKDDENLKISAEYLLSGSDACDWIFRLQTLERSDKEEHSDSIRNGYCTSCSEHCRNGICRSDYLRRRCSESNRPGNYPCDYFLIHHGFGNSTCKLQPWIVKAKRQIENNKIT
ncbi:MAG: HAD family hydrolase [Clostridiales bacterium]|nr:HAD family hydrolase [Clostridiales bacterium]